MKRLLLLGWLACMCLSLFAQQKAPKWMEKQKKAIAKITTYKEDGTTLHTGTGFFISEDGKLLSAYSLFNGAYKATVTDGGGKTYEVSTVLAADELYDVIKLQVEVPKKVSFLKMAAAPLAVGAPVYLQPYTDAKVKTFATGKVEEETKLKDVYHYYKLSFPLEVSWVNAPVLNEEGEVFGLAQEDASGKKEVSYAVSAAYAESLQISTMDMLSSTYTAIGIKKAWPADREQAQIALFLMGNSQDAQTYLNTLNDFVAAFPDWSESYIRRASHYAYHRTDLANDRAGQLQYLEKARADMKQALDLAEKKSDVLYSEAQLIYSVALSDSTLKDTDWTVEHAQNRLTEAMTAENNPVYHQLQGEMYFNQGKYDEAYQEYMIVNQSDAANASSWYMAAKSKSSKQGGVNIGEVIQLLDSTIACYGESMNPEMAPYILERIDWRLKLMQYEQAVADYDLYYKVVGGRVDNSFYYLREQAKFRQGDLEGALQDIRQAMAINAKSPMYLAEEASIFIRQKKYAEALQSIDKALALAPDFAACYRLRGVCFLRTEKKDAACEALNKAKELGDPVADKLIKENCQ